MLRSSLSFHTDIFEHKGVQNSKKKFLIHNWSQFVNDALDVHFLNKHTTTPRKSKKTHYPLLCTALTVISYSALVLPSKWNE